MHHIITLTLLSMLSMNTAKPTLIYIGDPMCSWCYGIAGELEQVREKYDDELNFELVMGGLRPYNTQTMVELKDFLSHHWEAVHEASGQPFTYGILDDQEMTYDTEPPARATVVVRQLQPNKEFAFFHEVQKLFYLHNKNTHLSESYHDILTTLEIDTKEFDKLFESDEMKELVRKDFERAGEMGVQGFPTLVLQQGDQLTLIANGYASYEDMAQRIEKLIRK